MTAKELAEKLNGCEYGLEVSEEDVQLAKENNLVIVYGYSDDNMEFDGALHDEVGCYDGGIARVCKIGVYGNELPANTEYKEIKAVWCAPDSPPWTYETDIPHETFNVYEDGELFCVGIVFSLEDV